MCVLVTKRVLEMLKNMTCKIKWGDFDLEMVCQLTKHEYNTFDLRLRLERILGLYLPKGKVYG